jgi:WD40 repeat protein
MVTKTMMMHTTSQDAVVSIQWSHDGNEVLTGSWDSTVRVYEAATGRETQTMQGHAGKVYAVRWSLNGQYIASTGEDETIMMWQNSTGKQLGILTGADRLMEVSAFSNCGLRVASVARDNSVRLTSIASGKEYGYLSGEHHGYVKGLTWSECGNYLATGGHDFLVNVWDVGNNSNDIMTGSSSGGSCRLISTCSGHTHNVLTVAWNPDGGGELISGGNDGT